MVYLEAIAGNTKLELMPGKQIEIKFADEKEDMGIFYLKETDSNSVWYAAQNVIKPAEESNVIYTYYGPPARFPGGGVEMQNYFKNNLKYPDLDKYPTLDGVVIISCIIDSNGYVTNSAIKKSLHPAYDSIALKVIAEMPQWKPATQDDKFVNTNYDIPLMHWIWQLCKWTRRLPKQKEINKSRLPVK
jgi:protein TonB